MGNMNQENRANLRRAAAFFSTLAQAEETGGLIAVTPTIDQNDALSLSTACLVAMNETSGYVDTEIAESAE
jgi:hypothetical protein